MRSAFARRCTAPSIGAVPITREPCDATVCMKPMKALLLIAYPPLPYAMTGSVPLGNASRFCGRTTTWPGEPNAGST
jgi:hypothetical protein